MMTVNGEIIKRIEFEARDLRVCGDIDKNHAFRIRVNMEINQDETNELLHEIFAVFPEVLRKFISENRNSLEEKKS